MAWLQLTLDSNKGNAEQLLELLEQFGALSVSLSQLSEEAVFHDGIVDDAMLCEQTCVTALLHEDTDLDTLLVCLRDRIGVKNIFNHDIELIKDKDWVNEYKQELGPKIFGENLCICPSWCTPPGDAEHTIILDPGLTFGTGTHDTTSMCLEWLASQDLLGKCMIDYGCGSGILALSALHLGAKKVYAVDIDPQALEATSVNAEINGLSGDIIIGHVEELELPVVDVVIANVLLKPLQELAPTIANLVKAGGNIVLSGILATQAEECLAAYKSWFNMQPPKFQQEWTLLQGLRT